MANVAQLGRAAPAAGGVAAPFLSWLPRELWNRSKDFFVYSAQFLPLPAGSTSTFETPIQADSYFLLVDVARVVTQAADETAAIAFPPLLITILSTASGRNLMDRAQHLENIAGTGQLPNYWPMSKLFEPNTSISTTLQNLDGANAFNVRISYLGFKVFVDF